MNDQRNQKCRSHDNSPFVNGLNIPGIFKRVPHGLRRHLAVKLLLSAFKGSHEQWIEFNGQAKAYVDLRDPEARNVFLKRCFEPDFFRTALAVLSDGGTFFDCGANFGLCTFGLLPMIKGDRLVCHLFEANHDLVRFLKTSSALFPATRIEVIEGCLSDRHGVSRFHINTDSPGKSHVAGNGTAVQRNIVLDDYLDANRINAVRFLKMDIEGQELTALRGFSKALNRGAIEVIYFEVRTELLHRYGFAAEDVVQFLSQCGFRVFYCRERDLADRSTATATFSRSGLNRLHLAEVGIVPRDIGTDLLAVHGSLIIERTVN
jgi:FkbM family methyltransferase